MSLLPRRPALAGFLPSSLQIPQTAASRTIPQPPPPPSSRLLPHQQTRTIRFMKQPRRPYTFTQIIQLSDGSTYTHRTTSPLAMYKSLRDKMNHLTWQPNNKELQNVEVDEAGKLAAFRERYGRSWDLAALKKKGKPESQIMGPPPPAPAPASVGADGTPTAGDAKPEAAAKKVADAQFSEMAKSAQEMAKPKPLPKVRGEDTLEDLLKGYARKTGINYAPQKRAKKSDKAGKK